MIKPYNFCRMYSFIQSLRFNIKLQENSNRQRQAREAGAKLSQVKSRPQSPRKEKKIIIACL